MPIISIIIPVYNVADYLRKTIESVVMQTVKDIDIILVDDGSTDGSHDICDEYANNFDTVRVIHKSNGGLSSARNVGAEIASGDYVMFLDGDDYLKLTAIETLKKVLSKYPSDIIQFEYTEVDAEGNPLESEQFSNDIGDQIVCATSSDQLFSQLYRKGGVYASGCTKLFKKELIQKIPFQNIRHEDEMWCTEAFQNNLTVTYISDVLYYYVMRDNSIIHSRFSRSKLDLFRIRETRIEALKHVNLPDLISVEYGKLFYTVLSLYRDAKKADDRDALNFIRDKFNIHKKGIIHSEKLQGKYLLLFRCMCVNYHFIDLYYWLNRKRSD